MGGIGIVAPQPNAAQVGCASFPGGAQPHSFSIVDANNAVVASGFTSRGEAIRALGSFATATFELPLIVLDGAGTHQANRTMLATPKAMQ